MTTYLYHLFLGILWEAHIWYDAVTYTQVVSER